MTATNPRLNADLEFEVISQPDDKPAAQEAPKIAPAPPGHETPPVKRPVKKGALDKDQTSLTLRQRDRFNQLVQSGIDPKVARQLAIALVKSTRPPLGAANARARRLKDEKGGDEDDTRRRVNEYLRSKGHAGVSKGGPGSGPQPGGGTHEKVVNHLKQAAREARAKGDHERADAISQKAAALAGKYLAGVRKSYAAAFVEGARERLSSINFDQLHTQARARAGGRASGTSRRAASDEAKAGLLERRRALQAELAGIDAQLKKSGPVAQEVAVDAPIELTPKQRKARQKLSEQLAARALAALKSAPPAPPAPARVPVAVSARVVKAAQPEWKRIVHSVVYSPGDVDAHGDYMEAEDIEKMAHAAMRSGLYVNHEHQAGAIEADIVESYVAPQDFDLQLDDGTPYHIPKGSHVMAMHVWGDEPWQKVLAGEYVGFSLEGTALREAA